MPRATVKRAVKKPTRAAKLKVAATKHRDAKLGAMFGRIFSTQTQAAAKEKRRATVNRAGAPKSRAQKKARAAILEEAQGTWVRPRAGAYSSVKKRGR